MKLASINNYSIQSKNCNNNTNPNFKGATEAVVKFWQMVDNGGRAVQFTVEDMTGTNIPRSVKGLLAGKKYTGHYNIPAFLQEAIREFLTGPTMCLVPFGVITLAKKLGGKSANIETANMRNLSYLLSEKTQIAQGQTLEESFYKTVIQDMLNQSTGKDASGLLYSEIAKDASNELSLQDAKITVVDKMVQKYKELAGVDGKKLGYFKTKKENERILGDIQDLFETTVKELKDDYFGTSFLVAKHSQDAKNVGATDVKNYANYTTAYINDYVKKYGEVISEKNIKEFLTKKQGSRLFTTICGMIFLTGFLMFQIPKIYTKASGKINPNASAIYDEAEKLKKEENK